MRPPPLPDATTAAPPTREARLTRAATLTAWAALVALCLVWELWLAPLRPGGSWWVLKALPLLLPLPGLLKYRMRSYRWLALLVWLYVAEGLTRATSEQGLRAALAALEVVLCLLLFAACAAHIRLRLRAARRAAQAALS